MGCGVCGGGQCGSSPTLWQGGGGKASAASCECQRGIRDVRRQFVRDGDQLCVPIWGGLGAAERTRPQPEERTAASMLHFFREHVKEVPLSSPGNLPHSACWDSGRPACVQAGSTRTGSSSFPLETQTHDHTRHQPTALQSFGHTLLILPL